MIEHKIKVNKTAYYYTHGELSDKTRYFHLVFHGYAQLAIEFIRLFTPLDPKLHFVLAPEGFSKFYKKGFDGEVGASWMTKHHRLDEIEDYTEYIPALYQQYAEVLRNEVNIIICGYSQGGSTGMRWIERYRPDYDMWINWAGWIPEDLSYEPLKHFFSSGEQIFVSGTQDPFLPQEKINYLKEYVVQQGLKYNFLQFKGGHELDIELYNQICTGSLIGI